MTTKTLHSLQLDVRDCPTCFVTYAVPQTLIDRRQEYGGAWYCPNGHSLHFTKTKVQELQEKLDHEKQNVEWWRDYGTRKEELLTTERRSKAALKGQLTKERKRVANGVCPCCKRTFQNLSKHMAGQHPEYVESPTGEE